MNYICAEIRNGAIACGLADETGTLLDKRELPVEKAEMPEYIRVLDDAIADYKRKETISGVALALPGIVDTMTGVVLSGGLFDGASFSITEAVTAACGLPCSVENVVKCAALGEYWLGAGQRSQSLFCLSVSTHISGAAVIHGHVLHGASYSAGEIGYMKIGSSVTFGEAASLQAALENVAAARQVPAASLDEKKLFRQAKSGDAVAVMAVRRLIDHLSAGIANICYVYNPDMIIIGGSLAAQMRYVRPLLMEGLQKRLRPLVYDHTRVTFARLGEKASLSGALYHFLLQQKEHEK